MIGSTAGGNLKRRPRKADAGPHGGRMTRRPWGRTGSVAIASAVLWAAAAAPAMAQYGAAPGPDPEHASCMGLGSEFYAHFATQQRAFVSLIVADTRDVPGQWFAQFATEKEGGALPFPCGTGIE